MGAWIGVGHVRYLSISVHTILVPKGTCSVPRDHFGTCQVWWYMDMSSSMLVIFGTKTSSVPLWLLFPLSTAMHYWKL